MVLNLDSELKEKKVTSQRLTSVDVNTSDFPNSGNSPKTRHFSSLEVSFLKLRSFQHDLKVNLAKFEIAPARVTSDQENELHSLC